MRLHLPIGAVIVLLAIGRCVPAQHPAPGGLATELPLTQPDQALATLDHLEELALANNPTLVQAGAQVLISRGKAIQAGLHPNPTIGYVAEQIGVGDTAGELQGMFVEQEIVTGHKLQLSRSKFVQEARQAQLQVLAQRYRVLYGVRTAFYQTLAWQRRLQVRENLLTTAQEAVVTVRELLNVGQANQSDMLRAELELQRATADARMAELRLLGAWDELSAVLGVPRMERAELEDSLDFTGSESLNRDAALEHLLDCSPQLRFARAEVQRDQIALQRERVEPIPNIRVRAETGYNAEAEETVAGVEVGLRLPLFDRNQGTILQAEAELTRAQAEVARVELMLRKEFAERFAEYEASRQSSQFYRAEILPKAEQIYESNYASFQQRRAAWPQVVDAQREYYELYEAYLNDLIEARRAQAAIASFLLEDGLTQPLEPTPEGHRDAVPKPR